ncbi:28S ribosomal protein S22, mitochondrial [Ischnura elegans]|uniref:28S ribosomal protein S22, mitochondrial n=1 Tax=Ischnura elegans TaxID=197161 RepID=UPI001ED866BF|nr:28S ribosomal protein S22, mitochondrial [Ischnura elegans]
MLCRGWASKFKNEMRPFAVLLKHMSENSTTKGGRDPGEYFFSDKVQAIMRHLSRIDMDKIFRVKREGQKIETPEYKFMTTEQLDKLMSEMKQKAEQKLQMPPVVNAQEDVRTVLSVEPKLKGYDSSKYVFTDITYGISDRDRVIVVRDTDGTLRKADREERHRMNQLYFERPGRSYSKPRMFEDEYLQDLLKRKEYEFILDRACAQFDPDDPDFVNVRTATYDHINQAKEFDSLRSTRHFGPLAFYLAWNNSIDDLLIDILNGSRLDEAVSLVELNHVLHPNLKSAKVNKSDGDIEYVKAYAELDSKKRNDVELALQNYAQRQFHSIELEAEESQGR